MKPVSATDYYEVRKMGSISSSAMASLADCYLPIIGPLSLAAYQCLAIDPTIGKEHALAAHGEILARLRMTSGQFEAALKPLEAVGLIRTFVKKAAEGCYFIYCLYAPLSQEEFLSDVLFRGVLTSFIGEEEIKKLDEKYPVDHEPEDMEECSESFVDFFHPDFSSEAFGRDVNRKKGVLDTGFDRNEFNGKLAELGITVTRLTEDDYEEIGKLGALYDLSSLTLADIAYDCYRDGWLDKKLFAVRCRDSIQFTHMRQGTAKRSNVKSSSKKSELIRMLDTMPPARYLASLQNGHQPASSDLNLIRRLSLDIGLPNPCINALLSYCAQTQNGKLIPAYCEKLAAAMVREGCASSRDAMDYLFRNRQKKKDPFAEPSIPKEPTFEAKPAMEKKPEEQEESLDELLAQL